MKLLHIIRSVDPKGGGPIEGVNQFAKSFQSAGHDVEIVSLDAPNADFVKHSPILVHALGPGMGSYGYSHKFKPWLSAHCHDYDAIILNGIWQYHSFAAHSALRRKNIPYFIYTHGMLDPWFKQHYPLKHLKKCLYWPWGEYPVLRDARKVLFTCEEEKLLASQSFWPNRWNEQVVNFGTEGQTGNAELQLRLLLNSFPHLQDKRLLLYLSRIHPKKGTDMLIEAFARVVAYDPNLHLVIAGPNQVGWQAELQRLAVKLGVADKITWPGMLSGDLKWGAYLAAEAFVLPSHQENFGIVVAEALSCCKPVLISNKVNIWREIGSDGAGFVDEDTLEGTLNNLQKWLALDAIDYGSMCLRAKQCFSNRFHIQKAAEQLLEIIGGQQKL